MGRVGGGDFRSSARSLNHPSEHELEAPASIVQPGRLERLIDVSPLAPDGFGNLGSAHPFLAQRNNLRAVESGRAAL